jgi:ABC-type dipeptide/oligopeptide/nickel transport system permease component
MFLEEIGKDYVRTARAKGLAEPRCCSATCCATR